MWIELPDELEEGVCCISNPMDRSALAINALFESMLKGQHIIFASRKLLKKIAALSYVNPCVKKFINWINQKYVFLYECREIIEYKIYVTLDMNYIQVRDHCYIVPLEFFYDLREAKLLTENETDGNFYLSIYNFVRNQKHLSKYFDVKFENDSGHGANVTSKLESIVTNNRIVLCILDSDREMKGGGTGSTYKGANNSYKKFKRDHVVLLYVLGVREKENLFPPEFYLLICQEKKELLTILNKFKDEEKIIKYFDIKDGVKFKKYAIAGWQQYYESVIELLNESGIYRLPDEDGKDHSEFVCVEGIGDKRCDVICQLLLGDENDCEKLLVRSGIKEEQKNKVREMRRTIKQILPDFLYEEWVQIYQLLFSWGCCISDKYLPIYQM